MSRFVAEASGLYRVTATVRPPHGAEQTLIAAYRGDPYRDPDAVLVHGEDIARQGARFHSNSGTGPTSLPEPALAVTFDTAPY